MQLYKRGTSPLLPHHELDPEHVRQAVQIAIALIGHARVIVGSGYSNDTIDRFLHHPEKVSERVRSNLLTYSRLVCQEQKETFFDLAAVEPIDIPEPLYPVRLLQMRIAPPPEYPLNQTNPYSQPGLHHALWSLLYLSVLPANSQHLHLYGRPLATVRNALLVEQQKRAADALFTQTRLAFVETLINGPTGVINQHSVIANPTIIDHFARALLLDWNIWGNALLLGGADLEADPPEADDARHE